MEDKEELGSFPSSPSDFPSPETNGIEAYAKKQRKSFSLHFRRHFAGPCLLSHIRDSMPGPEMLALNCLVAEFR